MIMMNLRFQRGQGCEQLLQTVADLRNMRVYFPWGAIESCDGLPHSVIASVGMPVRVARLGLAAASDAA